MSKALASCEFKQVLYTMALALTATAQTNNVTLTGRTLSAARARPQSFDSLPGSQWRHAIPSTV